MSTTIKSKYSTTASATPTLLAVGELAFNITDKKGWIGDGTTAGVQIIGAGAGAVDSITFGTTGLTPSSATDGDVTVAGTLNVGHGGTGNTATPAAGGVVYGDGSKMATTAAGTANQILTSQGSSAPIWTNVGVGGFSNAQIFTSSGSFTVPSTGKFKVTVVGGGSGGQSGTGGGGSGGNASGTAIKWFTGLTYGATCTVTIGAGGAADSTGGTSSFSGSGFTTITAGPGSAANGDININGGQGEQGLNYNIGGAVFVGGTGGSSSYGNGGSRSNLNASASNATGYGAGGGGLTVTGSGYTPGTGTGGIVVVEY